MSFFEKVAYTDALDAEGRLSELRNIINMRGDSNWLSSVRNEINYNHGLGSWYPYKDISSYYGMVTALKRTCFDNFLEDVFKQDDEGSMIQFVKCCQLVNSLNWDLLEDLQKRNSDGKSFLNNMFLGIKIFPLCFNLNMDKCLQ